MFLKFLKFAAGFFIIFISISLFYNINFVSAATTDCVNCRCICDDDMPRWATKKATNCDSYCSGSAENSCSDLCLGSSKIKSCEQVGEKWQVPTGENCIGADSGDGDKPGADSGDGDKPGADSGDGGSLPTIIENPLCPPGEPNCAAGDPSVLVGRIIKGVLGVVGSIALIIFIYGGFVWMTASGHSDMVQKGKDTLIWASIGLAVIFASYALVKFIFDALAPT